LHPEPQPLNHIQQKSNHEPQTLKHKPSTLNPEPNLPHWGYAFHIREERGETWGGEAPRRTPAEEDIAAPAGGVVQGTNSGAGGGGGGEGREAPPSQIFAVFFVPELNFRMSLFNFSESA